MWPGVRSGTCPQRRRQRRGLGLGRVRAARPMSVRTPMLEIPSVREACATDTCDAISCDFRRKDELASVCRMCRKFVRGMVALGGCVFASALGLRSLITRGPSRRRSSPSTRILRRWYAGNREHLRNRAPAPLRTWPNLLRTLPSMSHEHRRRAHRGF